MPRTQVTSKTEQSWKIRLQTVLQTRGISQRELSRLCNKGQTSVRHSLQPHTDVMLGTIYAYARVLGVSPHWLIFGKDKP